MEEYDKIIGDDPTCYIAEQARILHTNYVEDNRPNASAIYKKKLKEIIGIFDVGLRLAMKKGGVRRTRKRKQRKD